MMMSQGRWWLTRPRLLTLAVLLATLSLALTSVAMAPAVLGASGPQVISGGKAGELRIPSPKAKSLARLALPKGNWFVTAKAQLSEVAGSNDHFGVNCNLRVGSRSDRISAVPGRASEGGNEVPILLTVAGRLGSAGKARLSCVGEHPGVRISHIRINAMRVGRLTTQGIRPAAKTTGSGKPRVFSGTRAFDEINGNGAFHSVATLPLPKGAWWIVAKAVGSDSFGGGIFTCRLGAGADFDETRFGLRSQHWPSESLPLALQVVHRFGSAGVAQLMCLGPNDFDLSDIVITAVKAGKLTNRFMGNGSSGTTGSGWSRVISGWHNGNLTVPVGQTYQTISSMLLPKGSWMILGKLWYSAQSVPSDYFRDVCRIALKSGKDVNVLEYTNNPTRIAPLVMSLARKIKHPAALKLQCVSSPIGGTSDGYFAKLTALKAGSLTFKGL